ncbi:uncharacterized protein BDR25DRAFT_253900 [Lindgomyces ingoldianus]|uniref:Uncharacterized protein n=1 Tax=Lindgomyces ingoldianus TaxID=673940 RepID=A0ACB6R8H0_9PLEO|nr:uncharacterized protein BDR25DRAFT_253900 [Lindgomyces ingoldianus]KAF2475088.1 hypothetical protein BDR25DRAFT_253900 [Lindgomyces ingoldianus]
MERQPRRRRRPALSCLECRRRKIKCDRNEPCAHCVSAKIQCTFKVYSDGPVIQQQPQQGSSWGSNLSPSPCAPSPSAPTRPITEYSNHLYFPRVAVATDAAGQSDSPNTFGRNDIRSRDRALDTEPDLRDVLRRIQKLEESSASGPIRVLSENGRDILARQSGLQNSQIVLNKTRILRWSHWMGTAQEFATVYDCYSEASGNGTGASFQGAETRALLTQMGNLLQECKSIARSIKVGRPRGCLSCPDVGLALPSREVADTMVALYFRSYESTHRILHVPTFWAEYQKYWNHPESVTTDLRLRILLVIGIGSSLYEHGDTDAAFRNMVHQWVHAAQTWLSGPLKKDRLDIPGVQIYCLTILARQIFSIGGDLVWMSMGSLIHRAIQIGLHRDPKYLPAMPVLQTELRRRLWATILEMVVQSSLDSAMPPRISFDEFDTEPPSNNNDDEMDESTTALQPHPKGTYTTTSMQLILLDSLPARLRILQLLNGLHSELSYLDVLALDSEITNAYRSCSSFMQENEESGVTPFHRNLLHYLVRRFMIPLHCPFACQARTNPLFYYSLKVSLDTAMAIISPELDETFSHLMAIGGGMFREGIRYALAVLSIEFIARVEAQRLDGTLHSNSQYKDLLKQAMKDMILLSSERIRQGETNIKGHMFLSMLMAQAEAIEEGTSCELKIAQSAVDSLGFCRDLLQTRASTASLPSLNDAGLASASPDDGQECYGLDLDFGFFLPDAGFD